MTYDKKTEELVRAEAQIRIAEILLSYAKVNLSTKMAKAVNEDLGRAESLLHRAHDRIQADLRRYEAGLSDVQHLAEQDIMKMDDGTLAVIKEEEE